MKFNVFSEEWWLDAVSINGEWGREDIFENGKLVASFPWYLKKKIGFKYLCMPPMTQSLGPYIDHPNNVKYAQKLSREKYLVNELIDKLPYFDHFEQAFSVELTNWLPFYWRGFSQTTLYTYRLSNIRNQENLWKGLQTKIRTDIRKAKKIGVNIEISDDIENFIELNSKTFLNKGLKNPYSNELIKRIYYASIKNNSGALFLAKGLDGKTHAGIFLIWNKYCSYYLLGAGDQNLRNSGATSLTIWEGIKYVSQFTDIFDFEGSMNPSIESFFRGFGAYQVPYHFVKRTNSKILSLFKSTKSIFK